MSEPMAPPEPEAAPADSTRTGPGRLLIAVYALFALAASARAGLTAREHVVSQEPCAPASSSVMGGHAVAPEDV